MSDIATFQGGNILLMVGFFLAFLGLFGEFKDVGATFFTNMVVSIIVACVVVALIT